MSTQELTGGQPNTVSNQKPHAADRKTHAADLYARDIRGHRFGRLIPVQNTGLRDPYGNTIWLCRCDCGKLVEVPRGRLLDHQVTSCGCARRGGRGAALTAGVRPTEAEQSPSTLVRSCPEQASSTLARSYPEQASSTLACSYPEQTSLAPSTLARSYPELLPLWDDEKNDGLDPAKLSAASRKLLFWRCPQGHAWQETIASRRYDGGDCPFCGGKRLLPGENDLHTCYPALMQEWHKEKNPDIDPRQLLPTSRQVVWWRCARGHEWESTPYQRSVRGRNCPVCNNRKRPDGARGLPLHFPEIAAQWHPTKNGDLTPDKVSAKTAKRVWWQCLLGHEWEARVSNRTAGGSGCPECARLAAAKKQQSRRMALTPFWDEEANGSGELLLTMNGNTPVWWKCPQGHAWQATIAHRLRQQPDCMYCAGRRRWRDNPLVIQEKSEPGKPPRSL